VDTGLKMKLVLEETEANSPKPKGNLSKIEMPIQLVKKLVHRRDYYY
jgi:hypothetical protein